MIEYIDKSDVLELIKQLENDIEYEPFTDENYGKKKICKELKTSIDNLDVKDPYEQRIQYDSINDGIKAFSETYSFNIESNLFPQLNKEQQILWKTEIEQAITAGAEMAIELSNDKRYYDTIDFEKECTELVKTKKFGECKGNPIFVVAKHFFDLGFKIKMNK